MAVETTSRKHSGPGTPGNSSVEEDIDLAIRSNCLEESQSPSVLIRTWSMLKCKHCSFIGSEVQLQEHKCPSAPIKCPLGCGTSVPIYLMDAHKANCSFREVGCMYPGCTMKFMKKDETDHRNNYLAQHMDILWSMTDENYGFLKQDLQWLKNDLEKAEQELEKMRERCNSQQNEIEELKDRSGKQELEIDDLVKEIKELKEKLSKLESKSNNENEQPQLLAFYMDNFTEWKAGNEPWRSEELQTMEGYCFFFEVFAEEPLSDHGVPFEMKLFAAKGDHDEQLQWPAKLFFTLTLVSYKGGVDETVMECFSWERPTGDPVWVDHFPRRASSDQPGTFIKLSKLPFFLDQDRLHFKLFVTK